MKGQKSQYTTKVDLLVVNLYPPLPLWRNRVLHTTPCPKKWHRIWVLWSMPNPYRKISNRRARLLDSGWGSSIYNTNRSVSANMQQLEWLGILLSNMVWPHSIHTRVQKLDLYAVTLFSMDMHVKLHTPVPLSGVSDVMAIFSNGRHFRNRQIRAEMDYKFPLKGSLVGNQ